MKKGSDGLRIAIFTALMVVMYLSVCGKLNVAVKYAVNGVVMLWAAASYLERPDGKRGKLLLPMSLLYLVPFVGMLLWSMVLWVLRLAEWGYMLRGTLNVLYMVTNVLFIAGAYYLFQEKCLYYIFYGMCIANGIVIFEAAYGYGFVPFFREYGALVGSFARQSGAGIKLVELHDMAFGWGVYVIYFAMDRKGGKVQLWHLAAALFFFLSAFKRIGVVAVGGSLVAGYVYQAISPKGKKRFLALAALAVMAVSFGYIVLIKSGLFLTLVEKYQINTSGRDWIYYVFDEFYHISPAFLGNGIRFIFRHGQVNGLWNTVHNVYLEMYIELGFVMYFLWLWYELYYRQMWVQRHYGWQSTVLMVTLTLYAFMTFFTDNTSFQPPINTLYRLVGLVWMVRFNDKERAQPPWHPREGSPDRVEWHRVSSPLENLEWHQMSRAKPPKKPGRKAGRRKR